MLLAWAAWVYGGGKLSASDAHDVFSRPLSEVKGHKSFTEDQLLAIDKAIARLPNPMRQLINVHYRSSEDEPMSRRYLRLGCSRLEYRVLMRSMQAALYAVLRPSVDQWRHSVV